MSISEEEKKDYLQRKDDSNRLNIPSEIEKYKKEIGRGYIPNIFTVKILFQNPASIPAFIKMSTFNQATKIRTMDDVSNSLNFKNSLSGIKDIGVSWAGLAKSFQVPGITITQGKEVMHNRMDASGMTKGAGAKLKIDYYNDQWDINYQFWYNYIRFITDGRTLRYPDEYLCNIIFTSYTIENLPLKQYKFLNCYPVNIGDIDYGNDKKELLNFSISLSWEDFYIQLEYGGKKGSIKYPVLNFDKKLEDAGLKSRNERPARKSRLRGER